MPAPMALIAIALVFTSIVAAVDFAAIGWGHDPLGPDLRDRQH